MSLKDFIPDSMMRNFEDHDSLLFNWKKEKPNKLTYHHFKPYTFWKIEPSSDVWSNSKTPKYVIDPSTGDKYWNEDLYVIWLKCFGLALLTPIVHGIAAIVEITISIIKLLSLYDFWKKDKSQNKNYDFGSRLIDAAANIVNIIYAPIAAILLELSVIYGLISPRTGRKLFASLEKLVYGNYCIAPCFQPDPKSHFLGGEITLQNAW